MAMYQNFAHVYDIFMEGSPYEKWAEYIHNRLKAAGAKTVLDLACGTGSITVPLARLGYDMTAVDLSADMLSEARSKADEFDADILFLMQDMRKLDLNDTVDAAVCTCDALNYLLEEKDLLKVFKRVRLFLNPGGVFIFDMSTEHKYKNVLGNETYTEVSGGNSYIWKNNYHEESHVNEYNIYFICNDTRPPMKFNERHFQKWYKTNGVKNLLKEAGFKVESVCDNYSAAAPSHKTERVTFVAVCGKM